MKDFVKDVSNNIIRDRGSNSLYSGTITGAVTQSVLQDPETNQKIWVNGWRKAALMYQATGNDMPGHTVVVSFWAEEKKVAADANVVVGAVTAGDTWALVEIENEDSLAKADYITLSIPFGHSVDYTITVKLFKTGTAQTSQETLEDILAELQSGGGVSPLVNQVTHKTPADGTFAYTSNVTITGTGFSFTLADANCEIAYIMIFPASGDPVTLLNGVNGVKLTSAANVITAAGVTDPFASGDTYLVGVIEQEKYADTVNEAKIIQENNPVTLQNSYEQHVVDEANEAAGTYRYIWDTEHRKSGSFQWANSGGVTMTIWSTGDSTADDTADTGWEDITTSITGNASEVDNTGFVFLPAEYRTKRLMFKYVLSDSQQRA